VAGHRTGTADQILATEKEGDEAQDKEKIGHDVPLLRAGSTVALFAPPLGRVRFLDDKGVGREKLCVWGGF
jgi:hypothetical protein